jgi:hypothetical protein
LYAFFWVIPLRLMPENYPEENIQGKKKLVFFSRIKNLETVKEGVRQKGCDYISHVVTPFFKMLC